MDYQICRVTLTEEYLEVDNFIHDYFLPDMPLIKAFRIKANTSKRLPSPHQPAPNSKDFYLKAVNSKGELLGVTSCRSNVVFETDNDTPPEWKKMVEFMEFTEKNANLHNLPDGTIELLVVSVHPASRGQGVAKRLVAESMNEAKSEGFKAMTMVCPSEFTAKLARSMGWREIYRQAYTEYSKVSGVPLVPTPPHENMTIYFTEL